ncbi:hypothetical protein Tco_0415394 [Tanacetum coccineum]
MLRHLEILHEKREGKVEMDRAREEVIENERGGRERRHEKRRERGIGKRRWREREKERDIGERERNREFESLRGGFPSRWESVGFYPIDASIRGWNGLPYRCSSVDVIFNNDGSNIFHL